MTKKKKKAAIDWWARAMAGESVEYNYRAQLRTEVPSMISWVVRGGCAVQCRHCIFPFEGPKAFSTKTEDGAWLERLLSQLPKPATLVHEGRQLLEWQVPILREVAQAGYRVSLINNGQFTTPAMLGRCEAEGLAIDALDVSVDGTERVHNAQRSSNKAWQWAMEGMAHGRKILKPSGKLTSLYTITSLNYAAVAETGATILPLVDEWHLTTMSLRSGLHAIRASKRELGVALEQLFGRRWGKSVVLRTYSLADFVDMLDILGPKTARRALKESTVMDNAVILDVGIPLYFYPKSILVNETLVVDADMWLRHPYSIARTLPELQVGRSAQGEDLSHLSIAPIDGQLDIPQIFPETADKWWKGIGEKCFEEELQALRRFY